jgi:hypothetical protein
MNIAWGEPSLLETGVCLIPHPDKVGKGGEDAMFATPSIVGLADGVGGWSQMGAVVRREAFAHTSKSLMHSLLLVSAGVDPALYARSLMRYSFDAAEWVGEFGFRSQPSILSCCRLRFRRKTQTR